ncbi:FAD-binding protein [Telmatospirillum sp.]|uniref:FAD-binding protein n=1 Tax=Telmatospirillum sp. TaxID=2079197 RepID=UPI00284838F2|nr:FAD-binding protein [Telmatospirillum sp.]MDR3436736.1 FAD-binding protein [Telmatospirillum sp.]
MDSNRFDLIVVGAGLAGMTAAAAATERGLRVALVSSGFGMFVFGAGCIENRPLSKADRPELLEEAVGFFSEFTRQAGCPFRGAIASEVHLPTILGSFQTVSLAPFYLWSGAVSEAVRATVVGIDGLTSFDADFVTERLTNQAARLGLSTTYVARTISLPHEAGVTQSTLQFANRFDRDIEFRRTLLEALKPAARDADLIILPGLLGLRTGLEEISQLEQDLGCRLCELPTLPPSIPGLRLFHALDRRLRRIGVECFSGFPVTDLEFDGRRCVGVVTDTPARPRHLKAGSVILASGRFSGRLLGQSLSGFDGQLRPTDGDGRTIADNLHAVGALLSAQGGHGGNQRAILTGYRAGMLAAGQEDRYAAR